MAKCFIHCELRITNYELVIKDHISDPNPKKEPPMPTPAEEKYADIIGLPHHRSPTRPHMSSYDRAAQFSPFAALTGYDAAVAETARLTDREITLTEDAKAMLDDKLRLLAAHLDDLPEIAVSHFVPDTKKAGGAYAVTVGIVREINPTEGCIVMMDKQKIPLNRIRDLYGSLFGGED